MHPFPLFRQPRQHQLAGLDVLLRGNLLDLRDQFEVLVKGVGLEPGELRSPVARDIGGGFDTPSQKAAAEWRVGDHGDAEFLARIQDRGGAGLDFKCPGRVFDLKGRDWMDGVGTAESASTNFAETQVSNLAFAVDRALSATRTLAEENSHYQS